MKANVLRLFCLGVCLLWPLAACAPAGPAAAPEPVASADIADIIAKYRAEIPQQMEEHQIPGLAIAIVDDQGILWSEGFGFTDWDERIPVTPATLFSIQSMSKSFTATAAMFAAQDGLVDLDAPITEYLPDFRVNSIFEEHPEQKMTLRILLSHTAGFAHDTSYGGNNDHAVFSLQRQIESVTENWLMFPVGTRYSYSNVGIDLAAYILEVRSGMPFGQYVEQKVLAPLGMADSTLDYHQVRAASARAIGHTVAPIAPPVDFLLVGSGGVWTTAADMARYLQFHINKGAIGGERLLREDLAETMYTPPNAPAKKAYGDVSYALGITVDTNQNTQHLQHGGGGFGFTCSMVWYPALKLGSVVLTNAQPSEPVAPNLSEQVLARIIEKDIPKFHQRAVMAERIRPAYGYLDQGEPLSNLEPAEMIAAKALPDDAAAGQRRSAYAGTYISTVWGFPTDTLVITADKGTLKGTFSGLSQGIPVGRLTEVQPGLFFTKNGDSFDVRGPVPRFANINLIKAGTRMLPVKAGLYAACGLVFLSALLFRPAARLTGRIRRKNSPVAGLEGAFPAPDRREKLAGLLAALASIFSLICLAAVAAVPNLIYVPWPLPFADLTWWQFCLVALPFASLLLAVGVLLLTGLPARNRARRSAFCRYLVITGLALIVFNGLLFLKF